MSLEAAGAIAAMLSVSCALLAPFARTESVRLARFAHPDVRALDEASWRRPLWHFEALRAGCIAVGLLLSGSASLPAFPMIAAVALAPSFVVRSRAASARRRGRLATTRLLRATEAALRSGASLPEGLRRGCETADDRLARRPFVEALRAFDLGAPLDQALRDSARRAADSRSRIALETLAIGITSRLAYERAGALVAAVADRLAFEERLDEEIRARTGGLRAQVVLLALIVPALAAYLASTVPTLAATLGQPIGRYVLIPAALTLEVVGLVVSGRAIDGARR